MSTTLDIDNDALVAVKELASAKKKTAGKVISEYARRGIRSTSTTGSKVRNGFERLTTEGPIVTLALVDQLTSASVL